MPSKRRKLFREVYGEFTDAELEAYGAVIFRQIKEDEQEKKKRAKIK